MAEVPNFKIEATRNGEPLEIVSGSFTRSGSESNIKWSLVAAGVIEDLDIETDVFGLTFSVAGKTWTRFSDCLADSQTGKDTDSDLGDTIEGTYSLVDSDLLSLSCPKTLCFANATWVKNTFGNTITENGVLKTAPQGGCKGGRCTHTRLPGTEYLEGTFEVIPLSGASHHSVAQYVASIVGLNLVISTPDIPIIDTFTISSGTSWIDAIKANFGIWNPDFRFETGVDGEFPTLYILDVINSSGGVATAGTIHFDNVTVSSLQHSKDARGKDSNVVDHVIIVGRQAPGSTFTEDPDFTPRKIPEISLMPNFEITSDLPLDEILSYKEMGEYTGEFGTGDDAFTVTQVKKMVSTFKYYRYYDTSGGEVYLLLEQNNDTVDSSGAVVARHQSERKYGAGTTGGFTPVRSIEREFVKSNMPGTAAEALRNVKNKLTFQEYVIKALNQAITKEITEEQVLVDKLQKAGQTYMDNPNPMLNAKRTDRTRTAIDKTAATTQATIPMTTKFRRSFISRTSSTMLEKHDIDFDKITGTARLNSQIIQNPKASDTTVKGKVFRREYFEGNGVSVGRFQCYKKTVTIKHDDICTEAMAHALADRQFYRRSGDVITYTVKTAVPVPIGVLPVKVTFDEVVKTSSITGGSSVLTPTSASTSPGGEFYLYEVTEEFATSKASSSGEVTFTQTLKMRNKL